jgi:hypothetical protein
MLSRDILFGMKPWTLAGFVVMALSLTLQRMAAAGRPLIIGLMCVGTAWCFSDYTRANHQISEVYGAKVAHNLNWVSQNGSNAVALLVAAVPQPKVLRCHPQTSASAPPLE